MEEQRSLIGAVDRATLLRLGAAAAAAPAVAGVLAERARAAQPHQQLEDTSIASLQAQMTDLWTHRHALGTHPSQGLLRRTASRPRT